jgi:hypothetical protein
LPKQSLEVNSQPPSILQQLSQLAKGIISAICFCLWLPVRLIFPGIIAAKLSRHQATSNILKIIASHALLLAAPATSTTGVFKR